MGLTIWLVPSQLVAKKLESTMHSRPHCGIPPSISYPHFYPHITLASTSSSTPLNSIVSSIPERLSAIPVTFQALETGDHFFRSVYISVHLSPDLQALQSSIYAATSVFVRRTPSFPHMSLFYVDDKDAEERTKIAYQLKETGKIREGDGYMELHCGMDGQEEWMNGFVGQEIWIVDCDGPVEGWAANVLRRIELS